jgi:hypothetical protein
VTWSEVSKSKSDHVNLMLRILWCASDDVKTPQLRLGYLVLVGMYAQAQCEVDI